MNTKEEVFLTYLDQWLAALSGLSASEVFKQPQKTAVLSVDMINGFARTGNLSSPRVEAIIAPIVNLFEAAWQAGVRQFALLHDCHTPDALEFGAFAEHAVCGSQEAEAIDEIKALPFFEQMTILSKNSISASVNTGLDEWLDDRPELDTFIVVGDCTDICVYSLAVHLRTRANAAQLPWRVIVPQDCVATYDLPLDTALEIGAMPHPGDLLHKVFLYHMALNGIEVIKGIAQV